MTYTDIVISRWLKISQKGYIECTVFMDCVLHGGKNQYCKSSGIAYKAYSLIQARTGVALCDGCTTKHSLISSSTAAVKACISNL